MSIMLRKLTKSICLILGLTAAQHAGAFTYGGPLEAWQTQTLDYGALRYYYNYVEIGFGNIELMGPKNFDEGSRLTTPILTYAFDATFLNYFGAKGVAEVEAAMAVLNAVPDASKIDITKYVTDGNEQINYTAQALAMEDIKSTVMWLMIEHEGLMGETHVFDLRTRDALPSPPACEFAYFVINRNYDAVTYNPSTYVNGRQYSYSIWDGCPIGVTVGDAIEFPTDTAATRYTAVASAEAIQLGSFYLGLTQDDVAGLKYLYSKTNYAWETLDAESVTAPLTAAAVAAATTLVDSPWQAVNTTNEVTGTTGTTGTTGAAGGAGVAGAVGGGPTVGIFGGVEKITYVRVNYNSLLGETFAPIVYHYTIPYINNSKLYQLSATRTVTAPDIVFTAGDVFNPTASPLLDTALSRSWTVNASPYVSAGGGILPGTINPKDTVIFNDVGPLYLNENPAFLDSTNYFEYPVFIWGSFDGSTNPPVIYPTQSNIDDLIPQIFQVTNAATVAAGAAAAPVSQGIWNPVSTSTSTTTAGGTTVTGAAGAAGGAGGAVGADVHHGL